MNVYDGKSDDGWQQMSVIVQKNGKCYWMRMDADADAKAHLTAGGDIAISLLRITCIMIKRRKRGGMTDYAKMARRTITGT